MASLAVTALIGGIIGGIIVNGASNAGPAGQSASCAATGIADEVLASVVTISASRGQSGGSGSGEIIRADGYILTNNHVVSVAANGGSVQVLLSDGQTAPATIVGRGPLTDLAAIKASGLKSPKVISLGSSQTMRVGQPVVALGAPLGLPAASPLRSSALWHGPSRSRERVINRPCWWTPSRQTRRSTPATAAGPW